MDTEDTIGEAQTNPPEPECRDGDVVRLGTTELRNEQDRTVMTFHFEAQLAGGELGKRLDQAQTQQSWTFCGTSQRNAASPVNQTSGPRCGSIRSEQSLPRHWHAADSDNPR